MTDPTADAAKLLPCPFCGLPPQMGAAGNLMRDTVLLCGNPRCSMQPEIQCVTEAEAIEAWNTRPQPAPPSGEPDDADALAGRILAAIHNSNEMDRAVVVQVIAEWRYMQASSAPVAPSSAMIEAGAQRLVRWEDDSVWPTSWSALEVADARNEAERVWRSMWLAARKDEKLFV